MATPESSKTADVERSFGVLERSLDRFLSTADADNVFGSPVREGEITVLPASESLAAFGLGLGSGAGTEDERDRGGGGGGGGGSILSRPVAVVTVSPEGVRVEPIFDATKVALAAVTAAGFMLATWLGMSRPKPPKM